MSKHEENWDFYLTNVDDVIGSIYLDLGYKVKAPIKKYKFLFWVSIHMNNPTENGLSSQEESSLLYKIEDKLTDLINSKYKALYVGRLTNNGYRDFYFYSMNESVKKDDVQKALIEYNNYEFQLQYKIDENWSHYLDFLYPNPRQIQVMQNGRVVENLKENGDTLAESRSVEHWLYFSSIESLEKYAEIVLKNNFTIVNKEKINQNDEDSFMLNISRIEKVDLESVNEFTLYLYDLALEFNAEYDGWETVIIT